MVKRHKKFGVHPLFSLNAKLFFLVAFLILASLGVNTYFSVRTLRDQLFAGINADILARAQNGANQVSSILESWSAQVMAMLNGLESTRDPRMGRIAADVVRSNREFLGLNIYRLGGVPTRVTSFRSGDNDARFAEFSSTKVFSYIDDELIEVVASFERNQAERYQLHRFKGAGEVAIIAFMIKFSIAATKESCIAVLLAWNNRINGNLDSQPAIQTRLISETGESLLGRKGSDAFGKTVVWRYITLQKVNSGYKSFQLKSNDHLLFAFARLPLYGNAVLVVEGSGQEAYQASMLVLRQSALTAVLLVLIAVMVSFLGTEGVTRQLRDVTELTRRIASGDFAARIRTRGHDEVALLASSVNDMSARIIHLLREQMAKARIEQELETARMVQSTFFPRQDYQSPYLSVAGHYQPATECGGDWWGRFTAADGGEFVLIGDAMGHGAPAAMLTAMAYACSMIVEEMVQVSSTTCTPSSILKQLNRVITEALNGKVLMTFIVAKFNRDTGEIIYANAGHNFPLVATGSETSTLAGSGDPLGLSLETEIVEHSRILRPRDRVVFFTDGLLECSSPAGKAWGRRNLLKTVKALPPGADPAEVRQALLQTAFTHFGNRPIADDVTLVVAEVSDKWAIAEEPLAS